MDGKFMTLKEKAFEVLKEKHDLETDYAVQEFIGLGKVLLLELLSDIFKDYGMDFK